jgi:transcriptional regulator GlxA family with amidase domain
VALLQCGQVLDHEPDPADWQRVKKRLSWVSDGTADLARALRRTRSLSRTAQEDLIALLKLIAHQAATAHQQARLLAQSHQNQVVARALAYLEQNFLDEVSLDDVASAAYTSRRNLTRLLSTHTGATVVDHLHRLRVKCACDLLQRSDAAIIEVALAAGFGSIQQFNRVFRSTTGQTPSAFRKSFEPPSS